MMFDKMQNLRPFYKVVAYAFLAYAISWFFWLPLFWFTSTNILFYLLHILGGFGPWIAAYVFVVKIDKEKHSISYLKDIFQLKTSLKNYVLVIGIPLLILLLSFIISMPFVEMINHLSKFSLIQFGALFSYMLFFGGGLEEPGWRGYGLELLLKKYSIYISSLVIGIIWVLWHIPLFYIPLLSNQQIPFSLYFANGIALSFLLSFIYVIRRRNVWLIILLHAGYNTILNFYPFGSDQNVTFLPIFIATSIITMLAFVFYFIFSKRMVK